MIVPEYWAEARSRRKLDGRQITVRRFGWSDDGPEAAQTMAETRVQEAMERIANGEKLRPSEPKMPYNGADGVPIREQIVARHSDAVVTRNSYGARCLNTPNVLFADIDFEQSASIRLHLILSLLIALATVGVGVATHAHPLIIAAAVLAAIVTGTWLAGRIIQWRIKLKGGPEAWALQRIQAFVDDHPDWHLRIYRTPAGLRVLAMQRTFDPREPAVTEFFKALGTDPVYQRMCHNQNCFRARLSPKPWRIGISDHLRPRPGVWPVKPEHLPRRERWIADYEHKAQGYAACRFVTALGSKTFDITTADIQAYHDTECGADSGRPIA
jgi:hypothetical protein